MAVNADKTASQGLRLPAESATEPSTGLSSAMAMPDSDSA
jgi:hypothetical protein